MIKCIKWISVLVLLFGMCFAGTACEGSLPDAPPQKIEDHFLQDFQLYQNHPEYYFASNWTYSYGELEHLFDMEYFAAQKKWQGIESFNELSTGRLHPGENDFAIVVWTAPFAGELSMDLWVQKSFHNVGDGVIFGIYNSKKDQIFDLQLSVGDKEKKTFSTIDTLKKGDKYYFVVEPYGNNWEDSTELDITMTLDNTGGEE